MKVIILIPVFTNSVKHVYKKSTRGNPPSPTLNFSVKRIHICRLWTLEKAAIAILVTTLISFWCSPSIAGEAVWSAQQPSKGEASTPANPWSGYSWPYSPQEIAGNNAFNRGDYKEAQKHYEAALKEAETYGEKDIRVARALDLLVHVYVIQNRNAETEQLLKRSLAIKESVLGPEHIALVETLQLLGVIYVMLERSEEMLERSEEYALLQKRIAAIKRRNSPNTSYAEKVLRQDERREARALVSQQVRSYYADGRYEEAEALLKRQLAEIEKDLGHEEQYHEGDLIGSLELLKDIYLKQQRYTEAEPVLKRLLAMYEVQRQENLELGNPDIEQIEINQLQAQLYMVQSRYEEAEILFKSLPAMWEKEVPEAPITVAIFQKQLAEFYWMQGRYPEALEHARKSIAFYKEAAMQSAGVRSTVGGRQQRKNRPKFFDFIRLTSDAATQNPAMKGELLPEAFETAQFAQASDAAQAVAGMAARFARGDDALARIVRERQDALEQWQRLDAAFEQSMIRMAGARDPAQDQRQQEEMTTVNRRLAELEATLERQFPEYQELTSPRPLAVSEAQQLLAPDEALVSYLIGEEESFVWVVRKAQADFQRLDLGRKTLSTSVQELRRALEPFEGMTVQQLPAYPIRKAYELYRHLLAPVEPLLAGSTHLIIVPEGALQSLPFGVLVTEEPKAAITDFTRYREVPWLIKKYALSTLPSINSLRALRRFAQASVSTQPFVGFGDPLLQAGAGRSRGINIAALFARGAIADVNEVRRLPSLPETAEELLAMAKALRADPHHVHLKQAATETNVKRLNLMDFQILAFATHGLMAGEFSGLAEPALVLTPPATGTELDDGLLTASEVAQLKLNADWVLLSACNTAAADGSPGADGLSGLARAFFYAGGRALLVSHWAVTSEATVELTTTMFSEVAANSELSKAEALRRSMFALMNDENQTYYAHPMFWAPFVVVGEGG